MEAHVTNEEGSALGTVTTAAALRSVTSWLLSSEFDGNFTAHMGGTVLSLDGLLGTVHAFVCNESDTTGATVGHKELALGHGSVLAEDLLEGLLINVVGKGLNEDFIDSLGGGAGVRIVVGSVAVLVVGVRVVDNLLGLLSVVSGVGLVRVRFSGSAHYVFVVFNFD